MAALNASPVSGFVVGSTVVAVPEQVTVTPPQVVWQYPLLAEPTVGLRLFTVTPLYPLPSPQFNQ